MSRISWLIAFADLAAVLAAFFVMLLAMSEFDAPKLDRLALVLGRNEGAWETVRQEAPTAQAMRRIDDGDREARDYLATVIADRIARAGWPWALAEAPGGVVLRQGIRPDGPSVTADMIQYLNSAGYPISVTSVLPVSQSRRAGVYGVFDDGLKQAGVLAALLMRGGVGRDIPVATRFADDAQPAALEIVLDVAQEYRG